MSVEFKRASDRAIALVEDYYAAFNRGDHAAMLALVADEVVHDINQGGSETGREAFAAFLREMERCYREQLHDVVVMANDQGDRVAAEYVVRGTYIADAEALPPATGQSYELPGGAYFRIRDGRLTRISNYYNLQDWLAQVGAPA